jgi:hypothetical protein
VMITEETSSWKSFFVRILQGSKFSDKNFFHSTPFDTHIFLDVV